MAADQGQEKTEQPTQRRFEKAADEGQIAQSADFTSGLSVLVGVLFFLIAGSWFYAQLTGTMKQGLMAADGIGTNVSDVQVTLLSISKSLLWQLLQLCGPLILATFGVVILNGVMMTGMKITWKPLTPNFEKLDPVKGFSKIFSSRSVVRGLLAVFKVTVISIIVFWLLSAALGKISSTTGHSLALVVSTGWQLALQVALAVAASMVILGLVDLIFQKWKHVQDLKMTKQELKDEMKEVDGDPHVKARIRKLQREIATRTMLNDVKDASVVITNPTHLAIALRFDRNRDNAPIVLAKGADQLAKKIISIAKENGVPVIERKPVARALYGIVEVGDEIPIDLYHAVAEILAYVSRQHSIVRR